MAIGSGLSAQVGLVEESTYGTFLAPTRFLPFEKENLKFSQGRDELGGLLGQGSTVLRSDRWALGVKSGSGAAHFEIYNKGFGLLLKHMLGVLAITTPIGGINTRDHTVTLGDLTGKSLGVQVGRPAIDGTVHPFSYVGCKIESWELSNAISGFLSLALNLDIRDEDTALTLATATYPSAITPLHWMGATFTIADAAFPLKSIKIKGNNGLETKRYNSGSALSTNGLKSEPLQEKLREIEGEIEAEFTDLTAYNRFKTGTTAAIVSKWQGPLIEGALYYHIEVSMPVCRFDGETPTVDGPKRLDQKLPFKALSDGTQEPITIVYRTTDTAA